MVPIKHDSIADGDPLIDGEDWNANHEISNIKGWELIEEKTLNSGTTTTTFTNLNGNVDLEYLVEYELNITSGDNTIVVRPNNDSESNYVGTLLEDYNTTGAVYSKAALVLASTGWNEATFAWGKGLINPVSGRKRSLLNECIRLPNSTSNSAWTKTWGYWTNTTDNITSLSIVATSGSFSGKIRLYKKIPL